MLQTKAVAAPIQQTPSEQTYGPLQAAYRHFNDRLFQNQLPTYIVTLRAKGRTKGYYKHQAFARINGEETTDEIALNAEYFRVDTPKVTLSILVHEMMHQAQRHFGKPTRPGYHDKKWADAMEAIGLMPSNTGAPGGKRIGYQMAHYIIPGGPFDVAYGEFEQSGHLLAWGDAFTAGSSAPVKPKRIKFRCADCGLTAWSKTSARLACVECKREMARASGGPE